MKDFFPLKVWAKNMGTHYTWQNTVMVLAQGYIHPLISQKKERREGERDRVRPTERERDRQTERERETWISCFLHPPQLGTEPETQVDALTGN